MKYDNRLPTWERAPYTTGILFVLDKECHLFRLESGGPSLAFEVHALTRLPYPLVKVPR
jgi:hypothetical protein